MKKLFENTKDIKESDISQEEQISKEVSKILFDELIGKTDKVMNNEINKLISGQEKNNNSLWDTANSIWNGTKKEVKKAADVVGDLSYEIIKGNVEGVEGIVDSSLSVVADISGLVGNEEFREKVIDIIKEDYSKSIVDIFEPLNNDSLDNLEEIGTIVKATARATGMVAGGLLLGGPIGAVTSALVGEAGNSIESYYIETGNNCTTSIENKAIDSSNENLSLYVKEVANVNEDVNGKFNYVIDSLVSKADEVVPALIVAGIRTTETAVDMVGNVVLGITKFGEGIVDEVVSVAGMTIPSFKEQATNFISYDFAGSTVGKLFDNITQDSYLNDNEVGKLIEGICQGLGQITPALVLSVATGGTAAPIAGTIAGINIGLLCTSVGGRSMEKALNDSENVSYNRAFIYAQVSGAIEGAIESISGGIGAFGPGLVKQFGETFIGSAVGEGLEEVVSGLIEPVLDKIYKDENLKEVYMSTEFWQGIIEEFIIGAGTAAVANGITSHIKIEAKPSSQDIALSQDGFVSVETFEQIAIKEDIVSKVDSGEIKLGENGTIWSKEMGNYGEMRTAVEMTEKGWVELTRSPMELADKTMPTNGIDHVFYKDGKFLIVDSKSGDGAHLGVLSDGTKQLSDVWWNARLDSAVGFETADFIRGVWILNPENISRVVSQVDVGKETIYKIVDSMGNIINEGGNLDALL